MPNGSAYHCNKEKMAADWVQRATESNMGTSLLTQFTSYLAAVWLIPAAGFVALWLAHRSERYLGIWAVGMTALELNSLLIFFRSSLPEISIPASNILIYVGHHLLVVGCCDALGERRFSRISALLTALYSLASIAVFILANSYETRVAVGGLAIASYAIILLAIVFARWSVCYRAAAILLLATMSLHALASLNRALSVVFSGLPWFTDLATADRIFFPETLMAVFGGSTAFFLMAITKLNDARERELAYQKHLASTLQVSLQEQNDLQSILLHELKRPINSAMAAIDAADRHELNELASLELRKSQISLMDATLYLNELSNATEIETLIAEKNYTGLEVSRIVADLESKWSVPIEVTDQARECAVWGDAVLLDIALGNLIENAQKYGMTKDGCAVHVDVVGGFFRFDVSDDGTGIDSKDHERAWLKYVRLPHPKKTLAGGSGLGLHIVKLIVEAHSGRCEIPNSIRSTVRIELPVRSSRPYE